MRNPLRPTARNAALMTLLLGLAGAGSATAIATATAQTPDPALQPLPILALNCREDPGDVNPGGGRGIPPSELEEAFGCEPAAGVAVTVYNLDIDFHARCDTDAEGRCDVQAPPDPERRLTVAVHTASVDPAFAPVEPLDSTVHYTEFTGVGIVNLPVATGTPTPEADQQDRQLLTVNVATCQGPDCRREPVANALAQVSAGGITSRGAPWLATDEDGLVTFEVGALESETVDLMLETVVADETAPRFACTDLDTRQPLEAEWVNGREGSFIRITPISEGDIRCDVTLAGGEGAS
jgi:hypothetical protein